MTALAIVAITLALVPGIDVYRDRNDCAGEALHNAGTMETRHRACEPHFVYDRTLPAGGLGLACSLVLVAGPAAVAWRARSRAWLWATFGGAFATVWVALLWFAAYPTDVLFGRTLERWPYWLLVGVLATMYAAAILGAPAIAITSRKTAR